MNNDANNRFKNFLVNGFQVPGPKEGDEDVEVQEDLIEPDLEPQAEDRQTPALPDADEPALRSIESELIRIRYMLEDLSSRPAGPDLSMYMTTREQSKAISATISQMESAASDKRLVRAMEQIGTMREDFLRLCRDMRPRIAEMDAETVLSSFEAYCVDMENILSDGGVYIGRFDFDRLNTLHQRIVGVVPTGEKEKDGTIAERQSDGYKLGDKVLVKERVSVYKYDPGLDVPDAPEVENPSETAETPFETSYESGESPSGEPVTTEEKE